MAVYLVAGLFFAIFFLAKGITVVDNGARDTGIGFRIIIMPGVILFWPFLLSKWRKQKNNGQHSR